MLIRLTDTLIVNTEHLIEASRDGDTTTIVCTHQNRFWWTDVDSAIWAKLTSLTAPEQDVRTASETPSEPAPAPLAFKVGDRVRVSEESEYAPGHAAEIIETDAFDEELPYRIESETEDAWVQAKHLTLLPPEPPKEAEKPKFAVGDRVRIIQGGKAIHIDLIGREAVVRIVQDECYAVHVEGDDETTIRYLNFDEAEPITRYTEEDLRQLVAKWMRESEDSDLTPRFRGALASCASDLNCLINGIK